LAQELLLLQYHRHVLQQVEVVIQHSQRSHLLVVAEVVMDHVPLLKQMEVMVELVAVVALVVVKLLVVQVTHLL
jgi:hypothetical protein